MHPELGIIEGFYGKPWSWEARSETVSALAPHGYRFYLYAPKFDPFLRRRWQELHPDSLADRLRSFANDCKKAGVRFGIGLSPYELFNNFDAAARETLARKLEFLDDLGMEDLAILFDDMRGDVPDLARNQTEIVEWAAARTRATRTIVCPSYYSDDPILDRVFGERPRNYLEDLGRDLDSSIANHVDRRRSHLAPVLSGHLERIAAQLQRKPFLWDNYPVNDGQRMSQYLHLRGFTGRPSSISEGIAAHGINPALQPTLNRIPAITLSDSYREGESIRVLPIISPRLHRCARSRHSANWFATTCSHYRILVSTGLPTKRRLFVRDTAPWITRERGKSSPGSTATTESLMRSFRLSSIGRMRGAAGPAVTLWLIP